MVTFYWHTITNHYLNPLPGSSGGGGGGGGGL